MPTVLRFDGFRVVIYPNDHRPAHVHVWGKGGEAVFLLNCPDGPLDLRESFGFGRNAIADVARELSLHLSELCAKWSGFHGDV